MIFCYPLHSQQVAKNNLNVDVIC